MRFIHLADIHLGRRVSGFSLIEDQQYILDRIMEMTDEEKPDFIIIAGDVYDKLSPPVEAVSMLDRLAAHRAFAQRYIDLHYRRQPRFPRAHSLRLRPIAIRENSRTNLSDKNSHYCVKLP